MGQREGLVATKVAIIVLSQKGCAFDMELSESYVVMKDAVIGL